MSRRLIGLILLFVGSEILGVALGEWFYGRCLSTVPPNAMSSFSMSASHLWFLINGAGAGVILFIWSLLAIFLSSFFPGGRGGQAN